MTLTPSTDVVVVGSGGAALTAALAASDAGCTVTIVERSDAVGGTTAVSGGGVWMPCNHVSGDGDSRDEALTYMARLAGESSLLSRFVDEGPAILAGLEKRTKIQLRPVSLPD